MGLSNRSKVLTNEELVAGIANNDERALQLVYTQNFKSVLHFVLKNNGKEEDARDLFQDTIIATWMNIKEGKFNERNESNIGGYIFQIARNKWLDKLRSAPVKNTMRLVTDEMESEPMDDLDEAFEKENSIQYMESLYANLGDNCREILNRFYFGKKSLAEIGEELNYDAETLRTTKYRCMMKLRKMHQENELSKSF